MCDNDFWIKKINIAKIIGQKLFLNFGGKIIVNKMC